MHGSAARLLLSSSSSTLSASWTRREPSTNLLPTALRQRLCRRSSLPGACCSLLQELRSSLGGTNGSPRYFLHCSSSPRRSLHTMFWASHGPEFQGQLANFLKNAAILGGLCFVAFRLPTAAPDAHSDNPSEEGSVMRATSDHSTSSAPGGSLPT